MVRSPGLSGSEVLGGREMPVQPLQRRAANVEQPELDQHLRRVARVALRVAAQVLQAAVGRVEGSAGLAESRAVAGNHGARRQLGDPVEHFLLLGEAGVALQFREDHAEAVLPQRIGRQEDALVVVVEQHHLRVVPAAGDHLPFEAAEAQRPADVDQRLVVEARALLAGGSVVQPPLVPLAHRGGETGRDGDGGPEARVQRRVAAHVIRM